MSCGSCGADVQADSVYCPKCGERLNFEGAAADKQVPAPIEKLRDASRAKSDIGDEEQLWEGGYSGKAMIGSWILAGIVTVGLLAGSVLVPGAWLALIPIAAVIWIGLGGLLAYRKLAVHYSLTTQRFIHKTGILKQVTDRIEVIDIDDVTVEQGIVERMLSVGSVRINSSDRTHPELLLRGIDDVKRIADLIDDVRRKERRARGLHIEAI